MKLNTKNKRVWMAMAIAMLLMVWAASTGCSHQKPAPVQPSLYERLGGVNNIAVVIDDVIERAYVDPVFAANPKIHAAHQRFPKAAYKYNATALACQVMGGPQVYTGRSLKEAHQHLGIIEKEWTALIKIFHDSMDSFKVPAKEQAEIIAILEASKADVMAPGAQ
ncbi:MAG: group 1 truncated hemoglobin [Desulfobacteraceae bacterium]